jgi:hypothetical protein
MLREIALGVVIGMLVLGLPLSCDEERARVERGP